MQVRKWMGVYNAGSQGDAGGPCTSQKVARVIRYQAAATFSCHEVDDEPDRQSTEGETVVSKPFMQFSTFFSERHQHD